MGAILLEKMRAPSSPLLPYITGDLDKARRHAPMARQLFGSPESTSSSARPPGGRTPQTREAVFEPITPRLVTHGPIMSIVLEAEACINGRWDPPRGEDEVVEEYFGQLRVVPSPRPPSVRALASRRHGPHI
jgi:hypothetical protein